MYKKLKGLRTENHYTTKIMAQKLDISKPFYSQIENQRRRLTYDMAIKIAAIFNLKPDDIFYETIEQKDKNT